MIKYLSQIKPTLFNIN